MEPRLWFEQQTAILKFSGSNFVGFYLWGNVNVVHRSKPATLAALWQEIETACAAVAEDTFANVARTVVQRTQKCADAHGGHFEQLL